MSAYDEEKKKVVIEFVSSASVLSIKSEVLKDKVQEILLNNNIDISNTCFSCPDGTNAISGEHTGLQLGESTIWLHFQFMSTVNVTDWLYVSSICLVSFSGLNQSIHFC